MKPTPAQRATPSFSMRWRSRLLAASCVLGLAFASGAPAQQPAPEAALKARYAGLKDTLAKNQFQRPLNLTSSQSSSALKGEVYAVVTHPFADVSAALQARGNWCDILILHLNVKQCHAPPAGGLGLHVGKKFDQPLSDTYRVNFDFRVVTQNERYMQVRLNAPQGPVGTHDYQIMLEAIPIDNEHSVVHLAYSYQYGMAARMAMQAYLSTVGSDKLGFSIVEHDKDGQPVYIRNVRGVIERNTMRYYLAIEAYLDARSVPPAQQLEKRLHDWFDATERYALQLHEIDKNQYMEMKRKEVRRQAPAGP